jgi:phosphoserine phosphatase
MFTVTALVAPGRTLDPDLLAPLRRGWEGGALAWLAPGEAAEFEVAAPPADFGAAWTGLQAHGIDLAVQASAGRRRRMLIADMDSTMIGQECIDELAAEAGVGAYVAGITARAMNGELDFEAALRERVGLLAGLDAGVIERVLATRITPAAGGRALVQTMKRHGAYTALVSGGFTAFTRRVAGWFGFDENRANELLVAGGRLTGKVAEPILGRDAKVRALEEVSAMMGLDHGQVMAVGDGANDLGMLQLAGAGVALHARPAVAAQCRLRIDHGDLTALLYLQGYHRDEFVG